MTKDARKRRGPRLPGSRPPTTHQDGTESATVDATSALASRVEFEEVVREWHRNYIEWLAPYDEAHRWFPTLLLVLQLSPFTGTARLVVAWTAAVVRSIHPIPKELAGAYKTALDQLADASALVERLRSSVYHWPNVLEETHALHDRIRSCRSLLISQAGATLPTLRRPVEAYRPDPSDVFLWVVFRVLTAGGLSQNRTYSVAADLQGTLLGIHVDADAVRKRLERLRTSRARMHCACWDMLLLDLLGLPPTRGLMACDPIELKSPFETIDSESKAVRTERGLRDLEEMSTALERIYQPLLDEIDKIGQAIRAPRDELLLAVKKHVEDLIAGIEQGRADGIPQSAGMPASGLATHLSMHELQRQVSDALHAACEGPLADAQERMAAILRMFERPL